MTDPPLMPLPPRLSDASDPLVEALHLSVAAQRISERLGSRGQHPRERVYATGSGPGVVLRVPLPGVEGAITYFIERSTDAYLLLADPSDISLPTPFAAARRVAIRAVSSVILAETR